VSDDDIPPALLAAHPELPAIHAALAEHDRGAAITTRCPTCDALLTVTEVREVGVIVVGCPAKHVHYRLKGAPR
jgi:hypothetical protein